MQIAVTNQKTKSIRSACSLAGSGSHGISSATAAAPAPNSDSQHDQLDDRSPAHRGRDYSTRRRAVREASVPLEP